MRIQTTSLVLGAALVGAAAFALTRNPSPTEPPPGAVPTSAPPLPAANPGALPPGHVPVPPPADTFVPASESAPRLEWKAPGGWATLPNPSTMRLATYKIPRSGSDTEDAELSVTRAGGDTQANAQRWIGQFDDTTKPVIREKTVKGIKVTVVKVEGTYMGGMSAAPAPKKGYALLGAIVETPDQPYFFKMIGPATTVHTAESGFDAMIDNAHPL